MEKIVVFNLANSNCSYIHQNATQVTENKPETRPAVYINVMKMSFSKAIIIPLQTMRLTATILCREVSEWLLVFSGYGQHPGAWNELAGRCRSDFNVMVISLPAEPGDPNWTRQTYVDTISAILQEHGIAKATVISYSMGSRFGLLLAEYMPDRIRLLILMAPDGILRFTWNRVATGTLAGHWLFRQFVFREGWYLRLLDFLHSCGLLGQSLYAFSKWYMRDRKARLNVYHTWMNMRHIRPDLHAVHRAKQEAGFPLIAYFGKQDTVIRPFAAKRLQQRIPSATIIMLEKGHQLLDEDMIAELWQQTVTGNSRIGPTT